MYFWRTWAVIHDYGKYQLMLSVKAHKWTSKVLEAYLSRSSSSPRLLRDLSAPGLSYSSKSSSKRESTRQFTSTTGPQVHSSNVNFHNENVLFVQCFRVQHGFMLCSRFAEFWVQFFLVFQMRPYCIRVLLTLPAILLHCTTDARNVVFWLL